MNGPMSGILKGGPAIEPFRLIYITRDMSWLMIPFEVRIFGYLGRRLSRQVEK